ncbi:TIGR03767 family metallophosphoesterase [Cutibacterium equinum]|uniref:TIGR03767 family metallophosphoesterase n=1 Tax=Cutibacterium equinum TaxID=3016342 RepID=A0ABY7QW03_9ACTN|nr:TIGR03767 family metallophosphoesterase [Cutibacterium equinum]WCC79253.1 TIGR03767 family metallophosphoesterase [Cutibacterium equinum]
MMPENHDGLTRTDPNTARNTLGRRSFLGGMTLVTAAAVTGTTPALAHASKRLHYTAGTTLEQVGLPDPGKGYRRLKAHSGYPLVVREDLAKGKSGRDDRRHGLASLIQLTDLHVTDVQSPMRVEFLHPLAGSAFRPQEALGPLATASLVRRVNSLQGGPATGRAFDALVSTGDNTDNHEHVELDWYLTLLSGGTIIPNTGAHDHWESVQTFGDPLFYNPESHHSDKYKRVGFPQVDGYFRRVMAPVSSPGVKVPWYAVFGNHDDSVQGTLPSDWELLEAMYTSDRKITGFASDKDAKAFLRAAQGDGPIELSNSSVSLTRQVTADERREPFTPFEFIKAHLDDGINGSGPHGHGFSEDNLNSDRGYYTFQIAEGVTGISMDSTNRAGYTNGSIDDRQWQWLKSVLRAGSSVYYDDLGVRQQHDVSDTMFVLFSHHDSKTMNNAVLPGDGTGIRHLGPELVSLLSHYPNVIAWVNGHVHANNITAHKHLLDPRRSWWEINTASHVDFPQMARIIEIADNHDGTVSVFTTLVESNAPYQADYDTTDPDGLASLYREFGANDLHTMKRRLGESRDRNTELLLAHPWA